MINGKESYNKLAATKKTNKVNKIKKVSVKSNRTSECGESEYLCLGYIST